MSDNHYIPDDYMNFINHVRMSFLRHGRGIGVPDNVIHIAVDGLAKYFNERGRRGVLASFNDYLAIPPNATAAHREARRRDAISDAVDTLWLHVDRLGDDDLQQEISVDNIVLYLNNDVPGSDTDEDGGDPYLSFQ